MEITELQKVASQVRRDIVRQVHACQSGHPGGSLGCTDLLVGLYFDQMTLKSDEAGNKVFDMNGIGEDLFFLSNGHISPVFYSVLARAGYFPAAELATFRKLNSRLQGHPTTHEHLEGIRIASGSLGQGMSVAIGAAQAKKLNKDNSLVFVLMGDGEQNEGQVWEAAMYAPHHKVDNLVAVIDYNGQQIDGPTDKVMNNRDLGAKYAAFGWNVMKMNGNDMADVVKVLAEARAFSGNGQPTMILMTTEMGAGVDFMMGSHKWHGVAPNDEQLAAALAQLPETLGDY
ncbi:MULTISPECIES: transketolase [Arcicella]|uniref:Transketolase n=2 Tax=Arcicella TaxID=217140 RepID=A0ABU5SN60_9BACT|nr:MULTISPECIES: transketolase [unclassified Arcicella]MEA5403356.1 transketolase [Arcicella sp. DC2W]MEA5428706.1 transketolase [Arcicella sp. DC25W]|eukprot:GILI01043298.1.p1 GENE.GILI01043298.1~~GILI01043298.1.p1  ORF type:complete len:286 (+),score=-5.93 GILI01043298.1:118-975(+)